MRMYRDGLSSADPIRGPVVRIMRELVNKAISNMQSGKSPVRLVLDWQILF